LFAKHNALCASGKTWYARHNITQWVYLFTPRPLSCCVWPHQTQQDSGIIINSSGKYRIYIYIYIYIYTIQYKTFCMITQFWSLFVWKQTNFKIVLNILTYTHCVNKYCVFIIYIYIYYYCYLWFVINLYLWGCFCEDKKQPQRSLLESIYTLPKW
jgi:hypothetical protein